MVSEGYRFKATGYNLFIQIFNSVLEPQYMGITTSARLISLAILGDKIHKHMHLFGKNLYKITSQSDN